MMQHLWNKNRLQMIQSAVIVRIVSLKKKKKKSGPLMTLLKQCTVAG